MPSGIQKRRKSPITWSRRMPATWIPALRMAARHGSPRASALLGDGIEGGEVAQGLSLLADVGGESLRLGRGLKDRFERVRLELEDLVVVDEALLVELERLFSLGLKLLLDLLRAFYVFDPQIEDVAEAPGGGVVGRRLVGKRRLRGAERLEENDRRTPFFRP